MGGRCSCRVDARDLAAATYLRRRTGHEATNVRHDDDAAQAADIGRLSALRLSKYHK